MAITLDVCFPAVLKWKTRSETASVPVEFHSRLSLYKSAEGERQLLLTASVSANQTGVTRTKKNLEFSTKKVNNVASSAAQYIIFH